MAQIHADFIYGKISVQAGTGDLTFQSDQFAQLPVISSPDTLTLVLDPKALNGPQEIVYVTAHTAAATIVLVDRAQEGTTNGTIFPVNTDFVHNITASEIDNFGSGGGGGGTFIASDRDLDITDPEYGALGGAVIGTPGAGANDGGALLQAIADAMDTSSFTKRKTIHIPGGIWKMRDNSALPIFALIDQAASAGDLIIQGDGRGRSILYWPDALGLDTFGQPNYAINALNCSINNSLVLKNISIQGSGTTSGSAYNANATAIPNTLGYGIRIPNRAHYTSVSVAGFYTAMVHDGTSSDGNTLENTDHFEMDDIRINNCRDGIRVTNNNGFSRDQLTNFHNTGTRDFMYNKVDIGLCQRAGYVASDTGRFTDCTWKDCHVANIPFSFLKEGVHGVAPTVNDFITYGQFVRFKSEGHGNWAIDDQSRLGQIVDCRGTFGIHGTEINGGVTGVKLPTSGDHTIRSIAGTAYRTSDVTSVITNAAFNTPTPAGFTSPGGYDLSVGDHIAIAYSGAPTTPTANQLSFVDCAIVIAIADTTHFTCRLGTTGLPDIVSGSAVPIVFGQAGAIRAGSIVSSPLQFDFISDSTTKVLASETRFDLDGVADNDWTSTEAPPPLVSLRGLGSGANSGSIIERNMNTSWRCGRREMLLAPVSAGSFSYGDPLETGTNGARAIHSGDQIKPFGGFARSPGNVTTAVAGFVAARPYAWCQIRGTFSTGDSSQGIMPNHSVPSNQSLPHVGTKAAVTVAISATTGTISTSGGGTLNSCSPPIPAAYTGELINDGGTHLPVNTIYIQSVSADGTSATLAGGTVTNGSAIAMVFGQAGLVKQLQFNTADTSGLYQRTLVVGQTLGNASGGYVNIDIISPYFA